MFRIRWSWLLCLLFLTIPLTAQEATPETTPNPDEVAELLPNLSVNCEPLAAWEGVLTLGIIFAQSGNASVYGVPQAQAVQLAVQEMNEISYFGEGRTLALAVEDSGGDAEKAIDAMLKLIEENQAIAILGPTLSTEAFAADPYAQENSVPVMGVSNTANGITDMGDYVFRNSLPEAKVIPETVKQAVEILGLTRVGTLYGNDDDFTRSGHEIFVRELENHEVEITIEATFTRGQEDFTPQLQTLLETNPEALVVSALAAEAIKIVNQVRTLGYKGPIIGGNGFNSRAFIEQTGESSEGVIVGAAWNIVSDDPYSTAWVARYTEAYNNQPDQFATQAYTGAWLMGTALRCAKTPDQQGVRDALAEIRDFISPLGMFSFDENRDPVHLPVVQIIRQGSFVILTPETAR